MNDSNTQKKTHDIIISFSFSDIEAARELTNMIREMGFQPYMFEDRNRQAEGGKWLADLVQTIKSVKVAIFLLSPAFCDSKWCQLELMECTDRKIGIIPLQLREFNRNSEAAFMLKSDFITPIKNLSSEFAIIRDRVSYLMNQFNSTSAPSPPSTPLPPPTPIGKTDAFEPYPGARSFSEYQNAIFFGRNNEELEINDRLKNADVLVIHGTSGVGKSSLLQARIIPIIEKTPGKQVLRNRQTCESIRVNLYTQSNNTKKSNNRFTFSLIKCLGGDDLIANTHSFSEYISHLTKGPGAHENLLILDQFEEFFFDRDLTTESERQEFIDDIYTAINNNKNSRTDKLKVILSLRKEYLADIKGLLREWSSNLNIEYYSLEPISDKGAAEAIVKPAEKYLHFTEDVIYNLLHNLREVRIPRHDGKIETYKNLSIELVHLQVVCRRIWGSLEKDHKLVTKSDIESAAADTGSTVEAFVGDALNTFYKQEVGEVSHKYYGDPEHSASIINLGCQKFISPEGNRLTLLCKNGRVGRFSENVADELAKRRVLHKDNRGGDSFYELSHDLLVTPVRLSMNSDPESINLLYATDLLERVLNRELSGRNGTLKEYFEEERDLLKRCYPLSEHKALFKDELELLLRVSLGTGEDISAWCKRANNDAPDLLDSVLIEALSSKVVSIRLNAITGICINPDCNLMTDVIHISLTDNNPTIREKAAKEIYLSNSRSAIQKIASKTHFNENKNEALQVLANFKRYSSEIPTDNSFRAIFGELKDLDKIRIRASSWILRFKKNWSAILLSFIASIFFTVLPALIYKMIPSYMGWGVAQHKPGVAIGAFQGLIAAIVWGGLTALLISFYYYIFGNARKEGTLHELLRLISFGFFGASTGSLIIISFVVGVFSDEALYTIGWIIESSPDSKFFQAFWLTKYAFAYLVIGGALGAGMAIVVWATKRDDRWKTMFNNKDTPPPKSLSELRSLIYKIMCITFNKMWLLFAILTFGAIIAYNIPDLPKSSPPSIVTKGGCDKLISKSNSQDLFLGLFADISTQFIGAYFTIAGMLSATLLARRGLILAPSKRNKIN